MTAADRIASPAARKPQLPWLRVWPREPRWTRLVALVELREGADGEPCRHSLAAMAQMLGISERTVQGWSSMAQAAGYLVRCGRTWRTTFAWRDRVAELRAEGRRWVKVPLPTMSRRDLSPTARLVNAEINNARARGFEPSSRSMSGDLGLRRQTIQACVDQFRGRVGGSANPQKPSHPEPAKPAETAPRTRRNRTANPQKPSPPKNTKNPKNVPSVPVVHEGPSGPPTPPADGTPGGRILPFPGRERRCESLTPRDRQRIAESWRSVERLFAVAGIELRPPATNSRGEWSPDDGDVADLERVAAAVAALGREHVARAVKAVARVLDPAAPNTLLVLATVAQLHPGPQWRSRRLALVRELAGRWRGDELAEGIRRAYADPAVVDPAAHMIETLVKGRARAANRAEAEHPRERAPSEPRWRSTGLDPGLVVDAGRVPDAVGTTIERDAERAGQVQRVVRDVAAGMDKPPLSRPELESLAAQLLKPLQARDDQKVAELVRAALGDVEPAVAAMAVGEVDPWYGVRLLSALRRATA